MLKSAVSVWAVAEHFNCTLAIIYRLRHNATEATLDIPRSGRPRVTTRNQNRSNRILHICDRFRRATTTAAETPGRNNRISPNTVIRRLRENGLRPRRPYVGMVLNAERRRRAWANYHRRGDWNRMAPRDIQRRVSISAASRR